MVVDADGDIDAAVEGTAQAAFLADPASHSLGDDAYAYVPHSCAIGEPCRVHVAFHGCLQQASGAAGDAFYRHAGYNGWADTNHIVVLYPQTTTSQANPDACWDFWGYDAPDYASKTSPQLAMVKAMVDALASSSSAAPSGPKAPSAAPAPPPAPLPPSAAASGAGGAPPPSAPPATPSCVTASNADHVAAGRAYDAAGFAFAAGSSEALGLVSPDVWTSLLAVDEGGGYEAAVLACP